MPDEPGPNTGPAFQTARALLDDLEDAALEPEGSTDRADAMKAAREKARALRRAFTAAPPDADPDAAILDAEDAIRHALATDDPAALRRAVLDSIPGPRARPAAGFAPELPDAILRIAGTSGAVLVRGEVAILSGAGGHGKSTLTLQLAAAATGTPPAFADADRDDAHPAFAATAGLEIRRGPVLVATYEYGGEIARYTLDGLRRGDGPALPKDAPEIPDSLRVMECRGFPLHSADSFQHLPERAPSWPRFWAEVEAARPVMLVLDPAACAMAADGMRVESVRRFLDDLRAEAARIGCGVLVVAHSTKNAADAARKGEDPGRGIVSGSAAWTDAARGVLSLIAADRAPEDGPKTWRGRLAVEKSNFGPSFETVHLRRSFAADGPPPRFEKTDPPPTEKKAGGPGSRTTGYRSDDEAETAGWTKTNAGWTRDPDDPDAKRYPRLKDLPR